MRGRKQARFFVAITLLLSGGALGIAMRARADAPTCRYLTGTETVLDTTTKLTWQQSLGGAMKYDDAVKHCNELPIDGGGFRLPTVKELQTIIDVSRMAPAIDPVFLGVLTGSTPHWTKTKRAANNGEAWYVNFVDGSVYWLPITEPLSVRCVKGP